MKKFLKLLILSLTISNISSNSLAASASGNITAIVSTAISIANTADIGFGRFVADTSPSTILINPTGTVRTVSSGSPTLVSAPSPTVGTFNITGDINSTYSISLPSSVTLTSGSNNMTVNNFTSFPSSSGNLGSGGSQALNVGATLNVGASQASGNYTGTYSVTVNYN